MILLINIQYAGNEPSLYAHETFDLLLFGAHLSCTSGEVLPSSVTSASCLKSHMTCILLVQERVSSLFKWDDMIYHD